MRDRLCYDITRGIEMPTHLEVETASIDPDYLGGRARLEELSFFVTTDKGRERFGCRSVSPRSGSGRVIIYIRDALEYSADMPIENIIPKGVRVIIIERGEIERNSKFKRLVRSAQERTRFSIERTLGFCAMRVLDYLTLEEGIEGRDIAVLACGRNCLAALTVTSDERVGHIMLSMPYDTDTTIERDVYSQIINRIIKNDKRCAARIGDSPVLLPRDIEDLRSVGIDIGGERHLGGSVWSYFIGKAWDL